MLNNKNWWAWIESKYTHDISRYKKENTGTKVTRHFPCSKVLDSGLLTYIYYFILEVSNFILRLKMHEMPPTSPLSPAPKKRKQRVSYRKPQQDRERYVEHHWMSHMLRRFASTSTFAGRAIPKMLGNPMQSFEVIVSHMIFAYLYFRG